jgi:hypothetical protein
MCHRGQARLQRRFYFSAEPVQPLPASLNDGRQLADSTLALPLQTAFQLAYFAKTAWIRLHCAVF